MTERRDIELAIRARDLTTADLNKVQAAVNNLSSAIEKQAASAAKGETSLAELKNTLEQLRQAGQALAGQQGLLDTYVRLAGTLDRAEKSAEEAKAALAAFNEEASRGAGLTDAQTKRQNNLAESLRKAEQRAAQAVVSFQEFNAKLKEGEALTERQEREQRRLAGRVQETASRVEKASSALAEFNEEASRQNATKAANEQQRLARAADTTANAVSRQRAELERVTTALNAAGIDTNDLASAQQRIVSTAQQVGTASTAASTAIQAYATNAREAAAAARAQEAAERQVAEAQERRAATVRAALDAIRGAQERRVALERAVVIAQQQGEREAFQAAQAEVEANRRRQESLRALADQAERTADALAKQARVAREARGTEAQDAVLVAQGNTASINIANRRTIQGIEGVAAAATAQTNAIERATGPVQGYVTTLQDLERTLARTQTVAKDIDGFRAQQAAVRQAEQAYESARAELARLASEARTTTQPTDALRGSLTLAQRAAEQAGQALADQRARLASLESGLEGAGVDTRNLADAQERLARVAQSTTRSIQQLNAAAARRGVTEADNFGILGFRPFELQNLSFQVNDFFTQIASGTSATQAFAQQIGQVLQIQRVTELLSRALPVVLALGTAFVTLAASLLRANSQFATLRAAAAQGAFGGALSPQTVLDAANAASRLGASFEEARTAALSLSNIALSPDQYRLLTGAVANLTVAFGNGEQQLQRTREAFSGGTRAILELDNQIGFLNEAQRRQVAEAQTVEQRTQAVRVAIEAYAAAASRARTEATTPLGEALRDLRNSWREFLDTLASSGAISLATTVIQGLTDAVSDLGRGLRSLGPLLPILGTIAGGVVGGVPGAIGGFAAGTALTGVAGDQLRARDVARGGGGAGAGTPDERAAAGRAQAEAEANARAIAEQERVRSNAANELVRSREREAELERQIRQGTERTATAEQRRLSVEAARQKAIREFLALPEVQRAGIGADSPQATRIGNIAARRQQEEIDERREGAGRAAQAERRRELSDIEADIRAAESIRNDQFRQIQEDVRTGAISAVDGLRRLQEAASTTQPRFAQLAEEARRFNAANANSGDRLLAARGQVIEANASRLAGGGGTQSAESSLLAAQQEQLRQAIQERTNLVQGINALEQQGALTTSEAQRRTAQAYNATNASITEQINRLEQAVALQEQSGRITAVQAGAIRAQIELARAQLVLVDPQLTRIRQAFETSFQQGAVNAFNEVSQAIGEAIVGLRTWQDVATTAGRAVINMFAGVLKAIAQAIIQQQILNAIQGVSRFLGLTNPVAGIAGAAAAAIPSRRLGGVVGSRPAQTKRARPEWFANAPHYNNGGLPRLRPDEEAAILHRGEEVLTKDDPRNIMNMMRRNGEGGAPSEIGIRNVLVMSPDMIAEALAGAEGERVVVNTLRKNAATIRQIVR